MYVRKFLERHVALNYITVDKIFFAVRVKTKDNMYFTFNDIPIHHLIGISELQNPDTGHVYWELKILNHDVNYFKTWASECVARCINGANTEGFVICDEGSVVLNKNEIAEIFMDIWL